MIEVSQLNGDIVFLNPDLVFAVKTTPDTLIEFCDGRSLRVQESPEEIKQKFIEFKKSVYRGSGSENSI